MSSLHGLISLNVGNVEMIKMYRIKDKLMLLHKKEKVMLQELSYTNVNLVLQKCDFLVTTIPSSSLRQEQAVVVSGQMHSHAW
jgi:hypothetical protein